jgi:hypothetical protein
MNGQPTLIFLLNSDPGTDFRNFLDSQLGSDCWTIQRRQYVDTRETFYRVYSYIPVGDGIKTIARIKFKLAEA